MEKEQLVDLSEVEIDNSLNKAERIHSFIEKVGNPYAFRVGNVEVEISFESDGESLQDKMERYFETYSTLRQYMTDVVVQAEQDGYVQTMMHRRRALPELKSSNHNLREFGKRVALNMPVQGTAADIMKLAMVRVHDRLRREGLRGRLLMQVHDELIVECPEEEREQVERVLTEEMEHAAELSVPLTTDVHWGRNWLEAKG